MSFPILETDRLILRPHVVQDFADLAAMWGDAQVVRYISGVPSTEEASWGRLMRYMGHWQALGYGYWAVTLRDGGAYVGDAGFADHHRAIEPSLGGVPEAGWVLASRFHGQGMGAEVVTAIHDWAELQTDWARSCCIFDPAHQISQRLALKAGYEPVPDLARYNDLPTQVMFRTYQR